LVLPFCFIGSFAGFLEKYEKHGKGKNQSKIEMGNWKEMLKLSIWKLRLTKI
jgi:hypothetical protein